MPVTHLTNRENDVIRLVNKGLKNKEIAEEIGTTEHVIKNYMKAIFDKTGFSNRVELALWQEKLIHERGRQ